MKSKPIKLTPAPFVSDRRLQEIKDLVTLVTNHAASPHTLDLCQAVVDLLRECEDLQEYKDFCEDGYVDDLGAMMDQWRETRGE